MTGVKALIVTGGHGFQEDQFFAMFDSFEDFSYDAVVFPDAFAKLTPAAAKPYNTLVFYDMWQEINEAQKSAFIELTRQGKGLLILHHALISYQGWDEYANIVGGRFYTQAHARDGVEMPTGTVEHGVRLKVHIADKTHPVTQGIQDFEIVDETYNHFWVSEDVHILLTTEHPSSGPVIGWAHQYENSRVVHIELGHDALAYQNPSYRKLVYQAIRWIAQG